MASGTITIVILLVILIVAAVGVYMYFSGMSSHKTTPPPVITNKTTNTTKTTNTINTTTNKTVSNSTSTNYTNSTGTGFTSCLSTSPTAAVPNGNFSDGTYNSWNVSGTGWGTGPTNITTANAKEQYVGAQWSNYPNTYFASTYHGGGRAQIGNLTSSVFEITEPYLNFKIISPQNNLMYVELVSGGRTLLIIHYNSYAAANNTNQQSTFENASILVSPLLCRQVQLKIVDQSLSTRSGGYDFMSVGAFNMSKTPSLTPGIVVNQTLTH